MIKIYCDWCGKEAVSGAVGGAFTRRVAMTENGKLNIVISFEFPSYEKDKPEHLCIYCYSQKAIEAAQKLATTQETPRDE